MCLVFGMCAYACMLGVHVCIGEYVYGAYECEYMYHTLVRWRGENDWPVKVS